MTNRPSLDSPAGWSVVIAATAPDGSGINLAVQLQGDGEDLSRLAALSQAILDAIDHQNSAIGMVLID